MAMKRKLELDIYDLEDELKQKQLKLVPFPNYGADDDVPMSDADDMDYSAPHHLRLPSDASASSSASVSPLTQSPSYTTCDLQPSPFFNSENAVQSYPNPSPGVPHSPPGLMQPSANGFVHHGSHCTQIPKLRVACASGIGNKRTMWSHCEQCGAIQMVDCD